MTQFNRITFDSNIMGGRACIRGECYLTIYRHGKPSIIISVCGE